MAKYYQLDANKVFVGNGSDEFLALVFMGDLSGGTRLVFADITYSFYKVYASLYNIAPQLISLAENFNIVPTDYYNLDVSGVIVTNPNTPTGKVLPWADIEFILNINVDVVALVDEAYVDYGAQSASTLVNQYPNLLVVETFSKSRALAGMRVGYALGHLDLIAGLERPKNFFNSYPIDRLAVAGATAAVEDHAYLEKMCATIIATHKKSVKDLEVLGFDIVPSTTNFVFATHPDRDVEEIYLSLKE